MYYIFEKKFKDQFELNQYIFEAIDYYTKNTGNGIDSLTVIEYLSVLKKYIETKCPKREKNFLRLVSLVKSSLDENGKGITQTDLVFADILSTEENDYLGTHYALIKNRIDNEIIFDILLFLKYNLLNIKNRELNDTNESELDKKYAKELALINQGIDEASILVDDDNEEDMEEESNETMELKDKVLKFIDEYKPFQIKQYLDKYITGQEEAKKILSTTIYNHMIKIAHPELQLKKNNLLMVGPSGVGKTEMIRVLSKILPVPISIFDASGTTQDGWKGDKKAKDAVKELVLKTESINEAENGIVFLDEFDKMCRPAFTSQGENTSLHIQGEILAMIEGTTIEVQTSNDNIVVITELVDTSNILFVCAGAFDGIEDIVKKEGNKNSSMGFNADLKKNFNNISAKDITKDMIMKFGVSPELAGRLTILSVLHKLTDKDMLNILTKCENNVIDELNNIAKTGYQCEIVWKEGSLEKLIERLQNNVGARELRSIVFEFFNEILFDLSNETNIKKIIVKKDLSYSFEREKKQKAKLPIREI